MKNIAIQKKISDYGKDILFSGNMKKTKKFIHHGNVSCYAHCISVACVSICLIHLFHIKCNEKSVVRGALLHDYYLYDWHIPDKSHRLHGFSHASTALRNSMRDFKINKLEADIIGKHMFPLNIRPPKYRESIIVCLADKICAAYETITKQSLIKFK